MLEIAPTNRKEKAKGKETRKAKVKVARRAARVKVKEIRAKEKGIRTKRNGNRITLAVGSNQASGTNGIPAKQVDCQTKTQCKIRCMGNREAKARVPMH